MRLLVLPIFLVSVISQAAQLPPMSADIAGSCNEDNSFCTFFTPADYPERAVGEFLKSAKKSIRVASYNFNIPAYGEILNQKAREGVQVEYMIDFRISLDPDKVWDQLIDHPNITKVRLPGLRGRNPQMHHKLIIIDNEWLLTGSANFSSFGMVANYENTMAISDSDVIAKFNAEVDEMKNLGLKACKLFAPAGSCGKGPADYDGRIKHYLTTGGFFAKDVNRSVNGCEKLIDEEPPTQSARRKDGLTDRAGQAKRKNFTPCFTDPEFGQKVQELVKYAGDHERYVDGTLTKKNSNTRAIQDRQIGNRFRAYMTPEDNVEDKLVAELTRPLEFEDKSKSFVFVSTNFFTRAKVSQALVKLHLAGVRVHVLYDYGRFKDKNFRYQMPAVAPLGFFGDAKLVDRRLQELNIDAQYPAGDYRNRITVMVNNIPTAIGAESSYGANHNKMAVVGVGQDIRVINGSANWSGSAFSRNDENFMVIQDRVISAIFLREILSQLYLYRYQGNERSIEFLKDISFLDKLNPCVLSAIDPKAPACQTGNPAAPTWKPRVGAPKVLAVVNAPADPKTHRVWVWVPQLNNNQGGAVPLHQHPYFAHPHPQYPGKWIGTVNLPANWYFDYKYFVAPKSLTSVSVEDLGRFTAEKPGVGNDRRYQLPGLGVHRFDGEDFWGQY